MTSRNASPFHLVRRLLPPVLKVHAVAKIIKKKFDLLFVFFFVKEMKIISVDPAFKKCGIVVLDGFMVCASENLNFIGEKEAKQNQTDYTISLFRAIKATVDRLISEHDPDLFLLENQIGKFACTQVHSLLVAAIDLAGCKVLSQSPKFKLQDHWGLVDYQPRDCNAYNQNKNKSKAIATHFCKETHQEIDLDRDISDALLQGIYFQKYVNKIPFDYASFKKDTLINDLMVQEVRVQDVKPELEPKAPKAPKSKREPKAPKAPKSKREPKSAEPEPVQEVQEDPILDVPEVQELTVHDALDFKVIEEIAEDIAVKTYSKSKGSKASKAS